MGAPEKRIRSMPMNKSQRVVPGMSIDSSGQATIDSSLQDVLFDLALALEAKTHLPVDIQHVVAAVVMASRSGQLPSSKSLSASDSLLVDMLADHVVAVFTSYDGNVGDED